MMNTELELSYLRAYGAVMDAYFNQRRAAAGLPAESRQQWAALVEKHESAGLGRVAAIVAAAHEAPALYRQQVVPLAQFRASR
jgi:hypothetical protein